MLAMNSPPIYVNVVNYIKPGYRLEYLARHNDTSSQRYLAHAYQTGHYPFHLDFKRALYWYRRAAELGDVVSQYQLGQLYWSLQNKEQSLDWLYRAAGENHRLAQQAWVKHIIELSRQWDQQYPQQQSYSRYQLIMAKAHKGDPVAAYKMGLLAQYGSVYSKDQRSLYWYQASAKSYYFPALLRLSFIYDNGIGVVQNHWLAAYYYREYRNAKK